MAMPFASVIRNSVLLVVLTLALDLLVVASFAGVGHAYPFWPAAGVAVAFVMAEGPLLLPAVGLASLLLNLYLQSASPWLALLLALGVTCQTGVAALLGRRIAGAVPQLRATPRILAFLLATGPFSCLIGAAVSVAASQHFDVVTPSLLLRSGFTWWAGDVMGVLVMTPITLMWLPKMHHAWDGRRIKLLVPSLLLILFVQLAYVQAVVLAEQKVRSELRMLASDASFLLTNNLNRHVEVVDSVRRFYLSAEDVSAEQFADFTRDVLQRFSGLHGLSWNPVVLRADRLDFERRLQGQTGFLNAQIQERNASGQMVPAAERDRYVPVEFVEPMVSNRDALGYDILSDSLRAEAISRAERSSEIQATDPITLVQEKGVQQGVLVLNPVRAAAGQLRGFAVGVYRLGDLLVSSFSRSASSQLASSLIELRGDGDVLLARYGSANQRLLPGWEERRSISFGGRQWQLHLLPSEAAVASRLTPLPQQLLLVCLVLVLLMEAFLLVVTARDQMERRQARLSHHLASRDPLTNLLNRRAFLAALERARSEASSGLAEHVLLLFDLDHFKPVNDQEGHAAGDRVLQQLAEMLRASLRDEDVLARIGGDEFALILRCCSLYQACRIAEKMLVAIEGMPIRIDGRLHAITASIGVRALPAATGELPAADVLMADADQACYEAKRCGRNRLVVAYQ